MALSRENIAQQAARKLASAAAGLSATHATVGFDGFVDHIIDVVDKRHDFKSYEPLHTIAAFAKKVAAAAGESSNYELVTKQMKLGGNGPIMANALAAFGLATNYIGIVGAPAIHPVFEELAQRAKVFSLGEPGQTMALEFTDGKLLLGNVQTCLDVNWNKLLEKVGKEQLRQLIAQSKLIGLVNWTMLPNMTEIWQKMQSDILPTLPPGDRTIFIDLADPEKRRPADIVEALDQLTAFQKTINVTLGLNLKEAVEILEVLHLPKESNHESAIEGYARAIRAKLNLSCVVIHPRRGAAAATAEGSAKFDGPFVQQPKISTGAGDHFNAGFCLGRILGMSLEESLCCGVATSGYYVRTAQSPTSAQLAEFLDHLPPPQG
ncbi:MAG: hypothetical protein IT447_10520 [Phycisphaerales bacterium]|jgi:sugar/nucleoside kinase (ribokinase family)|nr:hypothetical protein [Phycisphaerales bacterium]